MENASVFKNFFFWIHSSKPEIDFSIGMDAIFNLAILAEKYTICPLLNQITDYIKTATMQGELTLNPANLDSIYCWTSNETSILRQICCWILVWQIRNREADQNFQAVNKEYEAIFSSYSDLGRDFFLWASGKNVNLVEPCQFHDHSDITNAGKRKGKITVCPYSDL